MGAGPRKPSNPSSSIFIVLHLSKKSANLHHAWALSQQNACLVAVSVICACATVVMLKLSLKAAYLGHSSRCASSSTLPAQHEQHLAPRATLGRAKRPLCTSSQERNGTELTSSPPCQQGPWGGVRPHLQRAATSKPSASLQCWPSGGPAQQCNHK